jgi:hypothetical protein
MRHDRQGINLVVKGLVVQFRLPTQNLFYQRLVIPSLSRNQFRLSFFRGGTELIPRHGLRDSANIFFPILPSAEGATSG